ncbi:hypothetical protein I551_2412 [Mycobacterium ulcerans str. Harvey]|uniref:Uncharacterized protein n=1 Tax=Mycobacterium ulcerans str. Harvey TaxID=1299332 RepID=A0ABP3AJL2_MYCUL|nr:hypothetical protein I551_2412 [Mycobacterium ulcerans str. Harvey]
MPAFNYSRLLDSVDARLPTGNRNRRTTAAPPQAPAANRAAT